VTKDSAPAGGIDMLNWLAAWTVLLTGLNTIPAHAQSEMDQLRKAAQAEYKIDLICEDDLWSNGTPTPECVQGMRTALAALARIDSWSRSKFREVLLAGSDKTPTGVRCGGDVIAPYSSTVDELASQLSTLQDGYAEFVREQLALVDAIGANVRIYEYMGTPGLHACTEVLQFLGSEYKALRKLKLNTVALRTPGTEVSVEERNGSRTLWIGLDASVDQIREQGRSLLAAARQEVAAEEAAAAAAREQETWGFHELAGLFAETGCWAAVRETCCSRSDAWVWRAEYRKVEGDDKKWKQGRCGFSCPGRELEGVHEWDERKLLNTLVYKTRRCP
jgi:hypothetical protein